MSGSNTKRRNIGIGVLVSFLVGIVGLLSDVLDIRDRLFPGSGQADSSSGVTAISSGLTQELNTQLAVNMVYQEELPQPEDGLFTLRDGSQVSVILSEPFVEKQIFKYVLITQRMDPADSGCQFCAPAVDGAIFTKVDDIWYLDVVHKSFGNLGYFGVAPGAEIVEIGPNKSAYLFHFSGGSTGLTYTDTYLVSSFGERFDVLFSEKTQFDNSMGCQPDYEVECWGYRSTLEFIQGDNVTYYDLHMSTRGTNQLEDGTIVPYDNEFIYKFTIGDNTYKLNP